jgi:hypothetical protein
MLYKAEYKPSDVGVWVYDDPIRHESGIPFHKASTEDEESFSIAVMTGKM